MRIENDTVLVEVAPRSRRHFERLNTQMWLQEAKAFVLRTDLLNTVENDGHVVLYDWSKRHDEQRASFTSPPVIRG